MAQHSSSTLSLTLLPVVAFFALAAPLAHAANNGNVPHSIHGARLDLHADLDWNSMVGVGGRLEFPIAPRGLIKDYARDELALSLGADVLFQPIDDVHYTGGAYLVPVIAAQWNFYLGSRWSIFPEAGMAAHVDFDREGYGDRAWIYPQVNAGLGGRCHINKRAALLMRVGIPAGLQVGLTF
jgi:hypothetical protein